MNQVGRSSSSSLVLTQAGHGVIAIQEEGKCHLICFPTLGVCRHSQVSLCPFADPGPVCPREGQETVFPRSCWDCGGTCQSRLTSNQPSHLKLVGFFLVQCRDTATLLIHQHIQHTALTWISLAQDLLGAGVLA